jgi:autotransporter-associated beta strand protein
VFNSGASAYTFTGSITIGGTGIANNSSSTQTFNAPTPGGTSNTITFGNSATAGDKTTFNISGGSSNFSGPQGSVLNFFGSSSAGSATLIAKGNTGTGFTSGGLIYFATANSTGGTARVELFAGTSFPGVLDISQKGSGLTIGSLEGNGQVNIGPNTLTIGSNNLSTTFSGSVIGTSGSFVKSGAGTFTFGGSGTYTGSTSVTGGTLILASQFALQFSTLATGGTGIEFSSVVGGHSFLVGNLSGSTDLNLQDDAATPNAVRITVGGNNGTGGFSGKLIGSGGITKIGSGTLTLSGANTYTGTTIVNNGCLNVTGALGPGAVTVNSPGCLMANGTIGGNVEVASGGTINGTGTLNGALLIDNGGIADLNGGTLTFNAAVTNNGLFILSNGAQLAGNGSSFTNNGTLDIITAGTFNPPAGFINNGTIVDKSVVKPQTVGFTGSGLTLTIASYTGHTYQLQKAATPNATDFANVGNAQQGSTNTVLTFNDPIPPATHEFYRVAVNP